MRNRRYIYNAFIGFLLLSLMTLVLFQYQAFGLAQGFGERIVIPVQKTAYAIFSKVFFPNEPAELQRLREENQQLTKRYVDQKNIHKEIQALRDQFATTVVSPKNLLPASIIGMRSVLADANDPQFMTLDKGSTDGVKVGNAVIYKDILLGKVTHITPHMSNVMLVSSNTMSIAGRTVTTSALGVVKGQDGGILFDNVILSDKLDVQDVVVTKGDIDASGIGYPPGLIIGKLVAVNKQQSALFQAAELRGMLDVKRLTTAFIVIAQ